MKLIDKEALVAEIERLVSNGKVKCQQSKENNDQVSYIAWSEHIATLGKILLFINTLKVKDVNLEKLLNDFQNFYAYENCGEYPSAIDIAEHFYELGLKAQKGE